MELVVADFRGVHKAMKRNRRTKVDSGTSRRGLLRGTAGAAMLGMTGLAIGGESLANTSSSPDQGPAVKNGRIKQSIVHWCFEKYWPIEEFIKAAKGLGCESIELVPAKYFPQLKAAGLTNAIGQIDMSPDPPFVKGFNNPKYWGPVMKATREAIDACAEFGYKNVICFTGYKEDIPDDVGARIALRGSSRLWVRPRRKASRSAWRCSTRA